MIPLKTFELREGHVTTIGGRTVIVDKKTPIAGGYRLTLKYTLGVRTDRHVIEEVTITSNENNIWYVDLQG